MRPLSQPPNSVQLRKSQGLYCPRDSVVPVYRHRISEVAPPLCSVFICYLNNKLLSPLSTHFSFCFVEYAKKTVVFKLDVDAFSCSPLFRKTQVKCTVNAVLNELLKISFYRIAICLCTIIYCNKLVRVSQFQLQHQRFRFWSFFSDKLQYYKLVSYFKTNKCL